MLVDYGSLLNEISSVLSNCRDAGHAAPRAVRDEGCRERRDNLAKMNDPIRQNRKRCFFVRLLNNLQFTAFDPINGLVGRTSGTKRIFLGPLLGCALTA
jgi:hypothetical protein